MSDPVLAGVSRVDIAIPNNVWWLDAFQFGTLGDTSWSFTGKNFLLDIKVNKTDATPLLALSSTGGTIVVDDAVTRVLHTLVTDLVIRAALPVTDCQADPPVPPYHYDLIMVDIATGERVMLMYGSLEVDQGTTVED